MAMLVLRGVVAGLVVVAVSLLAKAQPKVGALVLTLPIVSIVAFVMVWHQERDLDALSRLARETLVLVPLGLPFFVPLAFASRLGLGFASALCVGLVLASLTIGMWFWIGPQRL